MDDTFTNLCNFSMCFSKLFNQCQCIAGDLINRNNLSSNGILHFTIHILVWEPSRPMSSLVKAALTHVTTLTQVLQLLNRILNSSESLKTTKQSAIASYSIGFKFLSFFCFDRSEHLLRSWTRPLAPPFWGFVGFWWRKARDTARIL